MSEDEKDWKAKLLALKASGTLAAVAKKPVDASVPNQYTPVSPPTTNVPNPQRVSTPKGSIPEATVAALREDLVETKKRLSAAEEERNESRVELHGRDQELGRLRAALTEHAAKNQSLLQEAQRHKERSEQLEDDVSPIIEESDRLRAEIAELRALQKQLEEQSQDLTAKQAALAKRQDAVKEFERERNAVLQDVAEKKREIRRLNSEVQREGEARLTAENRLEKAKKAAEKARSELAEFYPLFNQATSARDKAQREKKQLKLKLSDAALESVLVVRDFDLVKYLCRDFSLTESSLPIDVAIHGDRPWPNAEFVELLSDLGFNVWEVGPHDDVELLIVGRGNWDENILEQQIGAREGEPLKIFTQELLVAALTCGRDPFDEIDTATGQNILESFGKGHPAIEYLRGLEFPWPEFNPTEDGVSSGEWDSVEETPLLKLGYHAGKTHSLAPSTRHNFLAEAFSGELPFAESDEYMAEWGAPGTRKRLRRMAWHLAFLIRNRRRNPSQVYAVKDWENDLKWLRDKYYKSIMRFSWPGSQNAYTENSGSFGKRVTPIGSLADIVGANAMPRTEVTKKLWAYIKKQGLQDSKNRRMINVDQNLRKVFAGKAQVSMFELTKVVGRFLK